MLDDSYGSKMNGVRFAHHEGSSSNTCPVTAPLDAMQPSKGAKRSRTREILTNIPRIPKQAGQRYEGMEYLHCIR